MENTDYINLYVRHIMKTDHLSRKYVLFRVIYLIDIFSHVIVNVFVQLGPSLSTAKNAKVSDKNTKMNFKQTTSMGNK